MNLKNLGHCLGAPFSLGAGLKARLVVCQSINLPSLGYKSLVRAAIPRYFKGALCCCSPNVILVVPYRTIKQVR